MYSTCEVAGHKHASLIVLNFDLRPASNHLTLKAPCFLGYHLKLAGKATCIVRIWLILLQKVFLLHTLMMKRCS